MSPSEPTTLASLTSLISLTSLNSHPNQPTCRQDPFPLCRQDPFPLLYRDADVEAMSAGWDDGSAYGYNHVIDDPAMGAYYLLTNSLLIAY